MPGEPIIRGTGAATGFPDGWRQLFDYADGLNLTRRVRLMMGPAATLDTAAATVREALACESIEPSVSVGSAVATLRIVYAVNTESVPVPVGDRRPPVYSIQPQMIGVDLRAHPQLKTISTHMPRIELLVAQGDLTKLSAEFAGNDLALKFARLLVAGVRQWEAPGFVLRVTRYYKNPPNLASDYAKINQVFAWGDIRTGGTSVPSRVDEPKAVRVDGTAVALEWRLTCVEPVISREENVVSWEFYGLDGWARWLYAGGTWEPGTL